MSAPQKPWENTRCNHQTISPGLTGSGRNALHSHAPQPSGLDPTTNAPVNFSQRVSNLPPLPQRPHQLFSRPSFGMSAPPSFGGYSGYGSYGNYGASAYGSYGGSAYGGYGPSYGGYGGMYGVGGYGYGSVPVAGGFENRFLQVAEESSRDAFQSIESIVRAFTSVSMMLESTYYAMYSSFRAILGVVDNFSRLRQIFVQFLSTITILRIIKNFYRRLLYWLGVIDRSPQADHIWESVSGLAGEASTPAATYPKWPLITFLGFLFGGPYLISKFFMANNNNPNGNHWDKSKGQYVKTAYPHQAGTENELSFQANEVLNLAPREQQPFEKSGWLLACNQSGRVGYIPITRLVATKSNANAIVIPSVTPSTEVTSSESSEAQSSESQNQQRQC